MSKVIYTEKQKFSQVWLWALIIFTVLLTTVIFGAGLYVQLVKGKTFGNNPMSDTGLIVTSCLVMAFNIALLWLFLAGNLRTEIDDRGIRYRFFPFHLRFRQVRWDELESVEVITYKPIRDYGGWGIRYGRAGKAYNASGDKGLQLVFRNGKRLLIGTNRAGELKTFLSTAAFADSKYTKSS